MQWTKLFTDGNDFGVNGKENIYSQMTDIYTILNQSVLGIDVPM